MYSEGNFFQIVQKSMKKLVLATCALLAIMMGLLCAGCQNELAPKPSTIKVYEFTSSPRILTDYKSPNNTGAEYTYVAFGDWPQTLKEKNVKIGSESLTRGGLLYEMGSDGNYYVKQGRDYYKVEPIVWRVLNKEYATTGEALLLAEKILTGGIPYHVDTDDRTIEGAGTKAENPDIVIPNDYVYSTLRAWLNGKYESDDPQKSEYAEKGFLQTAFTHEAQKLITPTVLDNSGTSAIDVEKPLDEATDYACKTITDKIFLLSKQEATTECYGFAKEDESGDENTRIRVTTDYAKATGELMTESRWWLRSPYNSQGGYGRVINEDGSSTINLVTTDYVGVVPALYIILQ